MISELPRLVRKLLTLMILLMCLAFLNSNSAVRKVSAASCCGDCATTFQNCVAVCQCCGCYGGIGACSAQYTACRNSCGGCP
jgi:hypothetical protein